MAISLTSATRAGVTVFRLSGRLDAHGSSTVQAQLLAPGGTPSVILDLGQVDYLSSAGVRIFVALHKQCHAAGGRLVLVGVQPYCREVLHISGLASVLVQMDSAADALAELEGAREERSHACGAFVFHRGMDAPGTVAVLGDIEDVLAARITEEQIVARSFSSTEYSIGLGALGPSARDVMPFIGEMMTIGGTMVWLPTDGNDTPDFLAPRQDSDAVVIRTGFNAALRGDFNEYVAFCSAGPEGATLSAIYRALFDLAKVRRPDFRGALGLALRGDVGEVLGCGVVRSPVAAHAPANGKWITDPTNYGAWFEVDETPRHRGVTGLICGIGLDLTADLSVFDQDALKATFYINPGNRDAETREKLHNHGVFFAPVPWGGEPDHLEREIQRVVEGGAFVDMRHLFDRTTVRRAIIGVNYIQEFVRERAG